MCGQAKRSHEVGGLLQHVAEMGPLGFRDGGLHHAADFLVGEPGCLRLEVVGEIAKMDKRSQNVIAG